MEIVYRSFDGRYSDNPRALHAALLAREAPLEHVRLSAEGHAREFPTYVTTVPGEGPEAVASHLQTWHGTPLETVHREVSFDPGVPAVVDRDTRRSAPRRPGPVSATSS